MPTLNLDDLNVILGVLGMWTFTLLCITPLSWPSAPSRSQGCQVVTTSLPFATGAFIVLYGIISVKIKEVWYLGEARKCLVLKCSVLHQLTLI